MAITRRQLNTNAVYVINCNLYSSWAKGTRVKLSYDDRSDMPAFRREILVATTDAQGAPDNERYIELKDLDLVVDTVSVPIKLAQDFIDCHDEAGGERYGGSARQCAALRAALVKAMPEKPEVLAAKALLKAAGYKVEKAS